MYILIALLSAFFAAITTILCKCGLRDADSDAATALRTTIVLVLSIAVVWITGEWHDLPNVTGMTLLFLILSGCATGGSWLCYFKALKTGDVNRVAPIDKSSTVLAMLMSFIFLGEQLTAYKIIAMVLIGIGTLMMSIHTGKRGSKAGRWMIFAWMSAIFAALTSILAKIGVQNVNSNLGTAIRTAVVLVMAWAVLFITGKQHTVREIPENELGFICLSGLATGASWLCYYTALRGGPAAAVAPIDKLSIAVSVLFSYVVFGEKLSAKAFFGLLISAAVIGHIPLYKLIKRRAVIMVLYMRQFVHHNIFYRG